METRLTLDEVVKNYVFTNSDDFPIICYLVDTPTYNKLMFDVSPYDKYDYLNCCACSIFTKSSYDSVVGVLKSSKILRMGALDTNTFVLVTDPLDNSKQKEL